MTVVCPSCLAVCNVPDAAAYGKKVRVTCEHCGNAVIADGTPPRAELAPALDFSQLELATTDDDATRIMHRPLDFSVHDEPTVVGQIPLEALEAERRFSQDTVPPPQLDAQETVRPAAPPTVQLAPGVHALPSVRPAAAPGPAAAAQTLPRAVVPQPEEEGSLGPLPWDAHRPRAWPWLIVLGVAVFLLVYALSR